VKFEVDGSVCCSCEFFERVGIVCRYILAIVHDMDESMIDVCWRASLGFYFGKPMYARVTSVIMQALESSFKKVKACTQSLDTSYPVYSDGANESCFSPFFKRGVEQRFITKIKYLLHQSAWKGCNEQELDIPASYMNNEVVDPAINISTHKELNPKRAAQDVVNQLTNPTHMRLTVHLKNIFSIVKRD
jgi:hypothetical protein